MDLTVQHLAVDGDAVLVVVGGEVDLATMPRLRSGLSAALVDAPSGTRRVYVDLDAVGLLEPVTLGVLLEARMRAAERGAELVLRCAEPRVRRVLDRTGLSSLVPVVDDVPGR